MRFKRTLRRLRRLADEPRPRFLARCVLGAMERTESWKNPMSARVWQTHVGASRPEGTAVLVASRYRARWKRKSQKGLARLEKLRAPYRWRRACGQLELLRVQCVNPPAPVSRLFHVFRLQSGRCRVRSIGCVLSRLVVLSVESPQPSSFFCCL